MLFFLNVLVNLCSGPKLLDEEPKPGCFFLGTLLVM
jgi:hypothetical protein